MRNKLTEGNENAHLEICFLFDLQHHLYMTNISAMYFFEEVIFMCLRKLRVFFFCINLFDRTYFRIELQFGQTV